MVKNLTSSRPLENERKNNRTKAKTKKRSSPRRPRLLEQPADSPDMERTNTFEIPTLGCSNMIIDDVTGNIAEMSKSVILNIENSSTTNTSSSESHHGEEDYNQINDGLEEEVPNEADDDSELHCDDWEIRMLAAELNRRESKRDEPKSSETTNEAEDSSGLLRHRPLQRSDTIDTDTEHGGMDTDQRARPRAASIDPHNLQRQKTQGVFKAISFDRDNDRL